MRNRALFFAVVVAVGLGYLLGINSIPGASAGPTEVLSQTTYITNDESGTGTVIWKMSEGRFVEARRYSLSSFGELVEKTYVPPTPKPEGEKPEGEK
jgi:hypothetical protein